MGIVGVKSTAGREVKFIDPSKTTKSESTWLGYLLCAVYVFFCLFLILFRKKWTLQCHNNSCFVSSSFFSLSSLYTFRLKKERKSTRDTKACKLVFIRCFFFLAKRKMTEKTCQHSLQWRTKVGGSKRIRYPRRPIITSNDGLSIAYNWNILWQYAPQNLQRLGLVAFVFFFWNTECSPWFLLR